MLSPLRVGTVLLQDGAFIPDSVRALRETFCPGWQAITNLTAEDLDRQIRDENWNFMFMAGALHGTSWGSWNDIAVRCAAIRVLRKAKLAKFNGFEITGIHKRKFLRLHYVTVTGHSRHIQQSGVLQKMAERIQQAAQSARGVDPSLPAVPVPTPAVAR